MPYGTQDGYAAPSPKEQLALDVYNLAHETNEYDRVTWDSMTPFEMEQVNKIYTRIGEWQHPPVASDPNYKKEAEGLSDTQWNALLDVSRATDAHGSYRPADHFAPSKATLRVLVREGMILQQLDGAYVTTLFGEKVAVALD